jgi:hypothetical protein
MPKFQPLPKYRPGVPQCAVCGKNANQLITKAEAVDCLGPKGTPTQMAKDDGTYNRRSGRFACTPCYIAIGMPTLPGYGWVVDGHLDANPYEPQD